MWSVGQQTARPGCTQPRTNLRPAHERRLPRRARPRAGSSCSGPSRQDLPRPVHRQTDLASNPPINHSPAKLVWRLSPTNNAAASTEQSGFGTIRQERRCQPHASMIQQRTRPNHATTASENQRVNQPKVQTKTGWASLDCKNRSVGHQAGFQALLSRAR